MGLFFPIHPPQDVNNLEGRRRAELKTEIMKVLLTDPDVEALLKDKLPELRRLLQEKTRPVFERVRRRP